MSSTYSTYLGTLSGFIVRLDYNNKFLHFSQAITNDLVDQVIKDTDKVIFEMKRRIEEMWMTCPSQRLRRSLATSEVPGFTLTGDNVGREYSLKNP